MKKRVLLGISGGVDSAVAASLLKRDGFEVIGIYLKMFESDIHLENIEKIDVISKKIGFEYIVKDISEQFRKKVYNYFVDSYKKGETPNPCAMCNREIKFGDFIPFLDELNCSYLSTGHYVKTDGEFLYQPKDLAKDQSYFMFAIKKEVIKKSIFPLSDYSKNEIKELANEIGLNSFSKQKESQDICFIENSYIDVLEKHFNPLEEGKVLNSEGEIIGNHKGFANYTVGQRKGFSLFKSHIPKYVIDIDSKNNQIIVGEKEELKTKVIFLKEINLFVDKKEFECEVKVRYRTPKQKAIVKIQNNGEAVVYLDDYAYGVAKGQATVFYENNKLIGGGWISGIKNEI